MILPREFFETDVLTCARSLIGCVLTWGECAGVVVETEAYAAKGDEACHVFTRPSARAFMERNRPGAAYVYFNYGMHWMLNVLVKGGREDGLILIRAVEPVRGVELMRQRRGRHALRDLCSGPGKLTQAFGIVGTDHEADLCGGDNGFHEPSGPVLVDTDVRIGISRAAHLPWRFLLRESLFVSVRATKSIVSGNTEPKIRGRTAHP